MKENQIQTDRGEVIVDEKAGTAKIGDMVLVNNKHIRKVKDIDNSKYFVLGVDNAVFKESCYKIISTIYPLSLEGVPMIGEPQQTQNEIRFKIGDTAFLKDNPLDEHLGEFIPIGNKIITDIKDVAKAKGTSGQWVKIAEHNDWLDSTWFKKIPQQTQGKLSAEDRYVLGFLFSPDFKNVVLIEKLKPHWQKGKYNGIGGRIEENETPLQAMQREFEEETTLDIKYWNWFTQFGTEDYLVDCFWAISKDWDKHLSVTKEEVFNIPVEDMYTVKHYLICNLWWLIHLAIDKGLGNSGKIITTEYTEQFNQPAKVLSDEYIKKMAQEKAKELVLKLKGMIGLSKNLGAIVDYYKNGIIEGFKASQSLKQNKNL